METFDSRFQRIGNALRELDEAEQDDVLGALEERVFGANESLLTPEQIIDVQRRLSEPRQFATKEQVEAVFAKYR